MNESYSIDTNQISRSAPAMNWFPMWKNVLQNRKVQSLSGDAFKAWVNMLCLACEGDSEGELPCVEDIAFALRFDDEKTQETIDLLVKRQLLDRTETGVKIHNWNEWQLPSYNSTKRVREYRERKRKDQENQTEPLAPQQETSVELACNPDETACNVSATFLQPPRIEENRREERREEPQAAAAVSDVVSETFQSRSRKPNAAPSLVLPDWLPAAEWDAFVEMRKKIKHPLTEYAMTLAIKKLIGLKDQGYDAIAILQKTILNGWRDFFPPDDGKAKPRSHKPDQGQLTYEKPIAYVQARPDSIHPKLRKSE